MDLVREQGENSSRPAKTVTAHNYSTCWPPRWHLRPMSLQDSRYHATAARLVITTPLFAMSCGRANGRKGQKVPLPVNPPNVVVTEEFARSLAWTPFKYDVDQINDRDLVPAILYTKEMTAVDANGQKIELGQRYYLTK